MSEKDLRYDLAQSDIPRQWYNIQADLPRPLPPVLHPGTKQPVGPDDLAPLFPMALIGQEVSRERYVDIPDEVREIYKLWRPTPLLRARRLEKALDTPAHVYYKYEGVSPSGSHKLNTATAQAWYNKAEGISGLTTETGAGQWGTALARPATSLTWPVASTWCALVTSKSPIAEPSCSPSARRSVPVPATAPRPGA
ncbi:MAG: pyridoxal-phosphate dependent enzyme [Anaerolineaceae bacterium]|nr:pyridoxal-phosphate dependent enzyme [Anaerolineaceae bacterium]